MTTTWLEACYNGNKFDVRVKDVNLMQVMDLIHELRVESGKQNVLIPHVFDIYYKSTINDKKLYVRSDLDLVAMFICCEGMETICLELEDTVNPIKEFGLYYERRRQNEEMEKKKNEKARLERECIFVEPLVMEVLVVDVETNETSYVRTIDNLKGTFPNETPNTSTPKPPPPTSSRTKLTPIRMKPSTSQNPPSCGLFPTSDRFSPETTPPIQTENESSQQQKKAPPPTKIPKTTARRKGMFFSKQSKKKSNIGVDSCDIGSGSRNGKTTGASQVQTETEAYDSDINSEDSDFVVSGSCDTESESLDDEENDEVDGEVSRYEKENDNSSHPFDSTLAEIEEEGGSYLDKLYKNGTMYVPERWGDIKLRQSLMFTSKSELLDVISDYCIQQGFDLIIEKSDTKRYTAECMGMDCTWKIHASKLVDGETWAIKVISGAHKNCSFQKKNSMATIVWMANKMKDDLIAQPSMPVKAMVQWFMDKFCIDVCQRTMYKVRLLAAETFYGGHEESYASLAAYCEVIKKTNPGSHAHITWSSPRNDNVVHFKSIFISFSSSVKGFLRGCRPLIGVDGVHLSGRFKGVLMTAVALDGNNQLFVVGYAIVGKESTETWAYFFRNLSITFKEHGCIKWDWTFISDRMKGVERALKNEFPRCKRRICAHHLYTNFREKWSEPSYHEMFWRAANATSQPMYAKALESMGKMSKEAVAYLVNVPQQWSKHQFDFDVACHHNTTNFVESFNALVKELRKKPVMELLEGIRMYSMDKIAEHLDLAMKIEAHEPTPYAKKKVLEKTNQARNCIVISSGGGEFEVHDGSRAFPVNLLTGYCSCGEWMISGIPCKHACQAIYTNKEDPMQYVHGFYRGQCYKLTYLEHMHPIPDKEQWPTFDFPLVFPPIQERSAGRPKRNRIRKPDEPRKGKRSTTLTCSICKTLGHNSRSCQGGPTAKAKRAADEATKRAAGEAKKRRENDEASTSKKP